MYTFTPIDENELEVSHLLEQGVYDFEVIKSTRKISKSNNPMAELQLSVWDKNGKKHTIFDYLVFSNINMNIKKISRFCKSVGLEEEFKQGQLREELAGFSGKLEIDIQDEQPKPTGGFYPKKNVVVDYIKISDKDSKQDNVVDFVDDEVPF